mgnify:FL=1
MNEQILPEAYFDSLSIAHKLDNFLDGFEQREIHLFAYFSAILFHYSGNPVDEWKYKFVITSDKYPHSKYLNDAIERNVKNGFFEDTGNYFIITGRGTDEFNKFKKFTRNEEREKFIDSACSTSILIPYKETKKALLNDPNLIKASFINNQDWIAFSNDKLKEITNALGVSSDELLLPAISWIEELLRNYDR